MEIENAMEIARQMAAEADFEGYIDVCVPSQIGRRNPICREHHGPCGL